MTDELLIKFLLKETSEEENITVQEWLSADAENTAYFSQFEKIWKVSENLISGSKADPELAWEKFKAKTKELPIKENELSKQEAVVVPIRRNTAWLKIAAAIVLALGAWTIYSLLGTSYTDLNSNQEILTKILPDGTQLTLNKEARISYSNNFKNNRSIKLQSGDVFFDVAHDKTHPFVIQVVGVSVEVVGTSFNIKHVNNQTEVNVETGIVKVTLSGETIKLTKGERVLIKGDSKDLHKEQNTDQLYNYYRSGLFMTSNTPLWKVAAVLSEAYGVQINAAPDVKDLPLNAPLKLGEMERNIEVICDALYLKQSRNQEGILLSKQKR